MDKSYAINALKRFRHALERRGYKVLKLILFGSYASGMQHQGSDIDVVVISDDFKNLGYWERIDILSQAIYEVFEPIEAVGYTSEEWAAENTAVYDYAKNGEVVTE